MADFLVVAERADEAGQVVHQVVSPAFFEVVRQALRPVDSPGWCQVRLVGEDAGEALAEMFAQLSAICIQGDFDEFLGYAWSEEIDVILAAKPPTGGRQADRGDEVSPLGQRLGRLGLFGNILEVVVGQTIDSQGVLARLWRTLGLCKMESLAP